MSKEFKVRSTAINLFLTGGSSGLRQRRVALELTSDRQCRSAGCSRERIKIYRTEQHGHSWLPASL